jgi:hypothetical protein
MKPALGSQKRFRVARTNYCAAYDGKNVEFLYELEGKLLLLTGELVVHLTPDSERVHIHYPGRLDPHDPPGTEYFFRLSQAHLRSLTSTTASHWPIDYLMDRALHPKDCVRVKSWEQTLTECIH